MGKTASTGWHDARRMAFAAASALPPEIIALGSATGRRLAGDVVALTDVPHYASSAMDGWAVAGAPPWRVVEAATLAPGEATAIVTGGLIPRGTSAVLRSENAFLETSGALEADGRMLAPNDRAPGGPRAGEHVRPAGEEARASDSVIAAGTVLNPAHIAVAAACGHDSLQVIRRPRTTLLLTGDEVVESGIPAPGQVRDSFGVQLPAFVALLGGSVIRSERLTDDAEAMIAAFAPDDCELIITTGGTGGSDADHLHAALESLGAELVLDGIAMRPGSPSLLARLPDGRFVVGLPGNPLAAMMGMLTIAQPLLARLGGAPEPTLDRVRIATELSPGPTRLLPYTFIDGAAVPSAWRGSGMLRGLAEAHGVLVGPTEGVAAGAWVEALPLPWPTD